MIIQLDNGAAAVNPPIEVICNIIFEFDRLSGMNGICANECRCILKAYGYELVLQETMLAQFRIQREHPT
jgi:hypothetical protein